MGHRAPKAVGNNPILPPKKPGANGPVEVPTLGRVVETNTPSEAAMHEDGYARLTERWVSDGTLPDVMGKLYGHVEAITAKADAVLWQGALDAISRAARQGATEEELLAGLREDYAHDRLTTKAHEALVLDVLLRAERGELADDDTAGVRPISTEPMWTWPFWIVRSWFVGPWHFTLAFWRPYRAAGRPSRAKAERAVEEWRQNYGWWTDESPFPRPRMETTKR